MYSHVYLRNELRKLKKRKRQKTVVPVSVSIKFQSEKDPHASIERLTGWPLFIQAIEKVAPDTPRWSWSKNEIETACALSGFSLENFSATDFSDIEFSLNLSLELSEKLFN